MLPLHRDIRGRKKYTLTSFSQKWIRITAYDIIFRNNGN